MALSWFCLLYTTQNNGCNYWKTSRQIGNRRNKRDEVSFNFFGVLVKTEQDRKQSSKLKQSTFRKTELIRRVTLDPFI